jgi:hypothetical protein
MPRLTQRDFERLLEFRVTLRRFQRWSEDQAQAASLTQVGRAGLSAQGRLQDPAAVGTQQTPETAVQLALNGGLWLSPSPRPAGYRGPAVTPVPGWDRQALCQQHCGFLMQSTWCVGHAGTKEAACAAVPVSITAGPAAKAVASAAEASTYVRAARGRPCFRLIDFPFGRRLGAAARVAVSRSRRGDCFGHSLAGAAETALKGR